MAPRSVTLFGIHNLSYHAGSNPRGVCTWYWNRAARNTAHEALCAGARRDGLAEDAMPVRIERRIRTEQQHAWVERLAAREILLANGIDSPDDGPDHQLAAP